MTLSIASLATSLTTGRVLVGTGYDVVTVRTGVDGAYRTVIKDIGVIRNFDGIAIFTDPNQAVSILLPRRQFRSFVDGLESADSRDTRFLFAKSLVPFAIVR
jgi:hypothetical protein